MASSRKALLIGAAAMAVVMGALLPATAWPDNHVVGEYDGWKVGVDYTAWARLNDPIPVGDTLEFIYPPGAHNVALVDEANYNECFLLFNAPVAPVWRSGDDKVQLETPGEYFFICSLGDHCNRGMKLAISAI